MKNIIKYQTKASAISAGCRFCSFLYAIIMYISTKMAIKRDRVNRVKGYVYFPVDGSALYPGQEITISRVKEADIDCAVRDAMEMSEPVYGDAIGDAIFDAMPAVAYTELLGEGNTVLGFGDTALGTGITYGDVDNICYSGDPPEE